MFFLFHRVLLRWDYHMFLKLLFHFPEVNKIYLWSHIFIPLIDYRRIAFIATYCIVYWCRPL